MSLSVFTKIPIPGVKLEHPLHYADSAVSVVKLRESLVSGKLKRRLHCRLLDLKLHPYYFERANVCDLVAKTYNVCVSNQPTLNQDQLWLFASVLSVFLFQFDDHFDKTVLLTQEIIARLSKEIRVLMRSLSRHKLFGLQGSLEDWPAEVPCKEAYLWLLREAEDLREGAAELVHDTFVDCCYGLEEEVIEWHSDVYRGDLTAWNLDRYAKLRRRSAGFTIAVVGPLFITHKSIQKEHIMTCTDLVYEAAIACALANDVLGVNKDRKECLGVTSLKIVESCSEIVQYHNEMVEVLHKKILDLECNTRHYMEEVEVCLVGLFLWQCHAKRYTL